MTSVATALQPSPVREQAAPRRRSKRFGLLGHAPALDGLRGVAVLLIVEYHFVGHLWLKGAWSSLDMFFGLSGFLITVLILDERRVHERANLKLFYARRAFRLLPALVSMLAIWVAMLFLFHNSDWFAAVPSGNGVGRPVQVGTALKDVGESFFYFANWDVISGGMQAPLSHLWSLAVEEQFYIIWPTLLLGLMLLGRRLRYALVATGIACSAALPWLYWNGTQQAQNRIYFGTDTRAASLLMGALAGLVWHERHALGKVARFAAVRAWAAVAVMTWVVFEMTESKAKYVLIPGVTALCVAQLIPYLADGRGLLAKVFSWRPLVWTGKRSYALYLWHYLWATWTHPLPLSWGVPLGLAGALVCTQLSWVFVESPALRYAKRFGRSQAPARALASVSLSKADVRAAVSPTG